MRKMTAVFFLTGLAASLAGCQLAHKAPPKDPKLAIDRYVKSQMLLKQGDLDAALEELAKAVEANPDLSIAYSTAGDIHRKREDWQAAKNSYESACRTNPYAFRPHYHLGLTYQNLAKAANSAQEYLQKAVNTYLRANMLNPQDFDTNLNLAACYFQLGKYDLAEEYCLKAIKVNPDMPQVYCNLAIIYDSQNRLYDAVREYKKSLDLDPQQPKVLLNLGSTYIRQNRLNQAINAFQLAAALAPNDPAPQEQIGSCCYRMGDYPAAEEAYRKSLKLDPNNATAQRGLGVLFMTQFVMNPNRVDLRDQALTAWNVSLELKPNQPDLRDLVQKYTPRYAGPEL